MNIYYINYTISDHLGFANPLSQHRPSHPPLSSVQSPSYTGLLAIVHLGKINQVNARYVCVYALGAVSISL